jgi:putative transposase
LGLNRSTVYGRLKRSAKALDPAQRSRKQVPQPRALSDVERQARQTGERRNQRAPQSHAMPRLTATRPNEVWTWDISKLPTIKRGVYLNLYVVMDLYSRFVVSWMVSHKENGGLAKQLLQQTLTRYELDD